MALTASVRSSMPLEDKKLVVVLVDFDSSYPTGGESFTPSLIDGLSGFFEVIPMFSGGYVFEWDATNEKLLAYEAPDPAGAGGAPEALVEVPNGTNLATLTDVPVLIIGN